MPNKELKVKDLMEILKRFDPELPLEGGDGEAITEVRVREYPANDYRKVALKCLRVC